MNPYESIHAVSRLFLTSIIKISTFYVDQDLVPECRFKEVQMKVDVTGNWKLLSFKMETEDGKVIYPYGEDAVGYLTYTEQNFMSVSIMRANRVFFEGGDLKVGTVNEKTAAIDDYLTYCGGYSIDGDKVVHHIEMSLFPNWTGQDQERFFELKGDELKLSTAPFLVQGEQRTARLIWQRVT